MMFRKAFEEYQQETYDEFHKIVEMASKLNAYVEPAELVLVGTEGSQKESLMETLLGHRLHGGLALARPLELRVVNTPGANEPRVQIRRDAYLEKYDTDQTVSVDELASALAPRNVATRLPIFVTYETSALWDVTLIDTPALPLVKRPKTASKKSSLASVSTELDATAEEVVSSDDLPAHMAEVPASVAELLQVRTRIIVAVEAAGSHAFVREAVEAINPGLSRSMLVYTQAIAHVEFLQTSAALQRYLSQMPTTASWFLVELPAPVGGQTAGYGHRQAYQQSVQAATQRLSERLEGLHYDRMHGKAVGALAFRQHALEATWRIHRDQLPKLQERMGEKKRAAYDALHRTRLQLGGLERYRLRSTMTTYAMTFLKDVERMVKDGPTHAFGWTLAEELDADAGFGPWLDEFYQPVELDAEAWGIDGAAVHMSGRQQFERLLKQFRAVAEHAPFGAVRADDVAVASDVGALSTYPQMAWVACDLAQQRVRKLLQPLVRQLHARAVESLLQVLDVVSKIGQAAGGRALSPQDGGSRMELALARDENTCGIYDYPYFLHRVRDIYGALVQKTAANCLSRCVDEFYATKIVYWDLVHFGNLSRPDRLADWDLFERKQYCMDLARLVFNDLRARIVQNVLLKHYSLLLLPLQSDIWSLVQASFTELADDDIAALFELDANRDALSRAELSLDAQFRALTEQEMAFMMSSNNFSHPR